MAAINPPEGRCKSARNRADLWRAGNPQVLWNGDPEQHGFMTRPTVRIEIDTATVAPGDTLRGAVVVVVGDKPIDGKGLTLTLGWKTDGKGTDHKETVASRTLGTGSLAEGQTARLPFAVPIPADAPLSYKGTIVEVNWQAVVAIDLPWARDVKTEIPVVVDLKGPGRDFSVRSLAVPSQKAVEAKWLVWAVAGGGLVIGLIVLMGFGWAFGVACLLLDLVAVAWFARSALAHRALADSTLDIEPSSDGSRTAGKLRVHVAAGVLDDLESVDAHLALHEWAIKPKRKGSNGTSYEYNHIAQRDPIRLLPVPGQPGAFVGDVRIGRGQPCGVDVENHRVYWTVDVQVFLRGRADPTWQSVIAVSAATTPTSPHDGVLSHERAAAP